MQTKSCAFFGHRHLFVEQYRDKLIQIITELIENRGVGQFYSGYRGDFDIYCGNLVFELKNKYPQIKNTMVLSYMPDSEFILPKCYDDTAYLLDRQVPKRLAIIETNKLLADSADYIIAGVITHGGGAYAALQYANKRKKPIFSVIDGWEL